MSPALFPPQRSVRRLASAVALLVLAPAASVSAAPWRLEAIGSSTGVAELHALEFDAQGHGLLSWNGAQQGHEPPVFGGLATRDPSGSWLRPPDLVGVDPSDAQLHLHGTSRALLLAREAPTSTSRRRLVVADGQSDGGFGKFGVLEDFVAKHWSAVNEAGDAVAAWTVERSPFLRVAERAEGKDFAPARDIAVAKTAAVAINAQGDRVVVWRAGRRLAARLQPAGGEWSRTVRFGRVNAIQSLRLSALFGRNGRVVVTWGSQGRPCGVSVRDIDGKWRNRTLERRCGPSGTDSHAAPVVPIDDGGGATYVAWTGSTPGGRRAVKFARVGPGASRVPLVLSRERGAVLDDAAPGAGRAIAVTYTAPRPTKARPYIVATFAAVRRAGGSFGRATRLTPATVFAARGSRVAFQPLTGEPIAAFPYLVGRTVAVGAAVGPPAPPAAPGAAG